MLLPAGEDALVAGIYDYFKNDTELAHILVAGPSKAGAQLEGSKAFSKKFMERHGIPTAAYREFDADSFEEGVAYLGAHSLPIVLKADGLAAGKGVVITDDRQEAVEVFTSMIKESKFGDAGKKVVVEAFLSGVELSVFVLTDGKEFVLLPEAKDYKRIGEGDMGPNTGGMGAVSPVPFAQGGFMEKTLEKVVRPTVKGLAEEGITYHGFIFFGLINVAGEPFVIEYNCRMGDPETEVVMPRLENDLVELLLKMGKSELGSVQVKHSKEAATTVMLVSKGYPGDYEKGKPISGLESISEGIAYHAGTKVGPDGRVLTNGGRVIALTCMGGDIATALKGSYANAALLDFEGKYYRKDIGYEFI